jgi:hypothetical protein
VLGEKTSFSMSSPRGSYTADQAIGDIVRAVDGAISRLEDWKTAEQTITRILFVMETRLAVVKRMIEEGREKGCS